MGTRNRKAAAVTKAKPDPNVFNPTAWPVCADCETPYVVRRGLVLEEDYSIGRSYRWLYQRDCRHKKAPYRMMSANGVFLCKHCSGPLKKVNDSGFFLHDNSTSWYAGRQMDHDAEV